MNSGRVGPVEPGMMSRGGFVSIVAILLLATPAWAADAKFSAPRVDPNIAVAPRPTTNPLPASSPFPVATKPFTASRSVADPLPASIIATPEHQRRHRHHGPVTFVAAPAPAPQIVVVQQPIYYQQLVEAPPAQCVMPGYWSYRWVPYTATESVWVPGSWAADGSWADSHWESRPYTSGYYEPFWMPSQPC